VPKSHAASKALSSAEFSRLEEALPRNAILEGLGTSEIAKVVRSARLVHLPVRYPIYQPDELIRDVYFPLDCVLSIVTRMQDGSAIEVGTVGREGVSAFPLLLGAGTTANESYCQVPGQAVKMNKAPNMLT
jgi:hypothetical protein